jgi:hypothetical protein
VLAVEVGLHFCEPLDNSLDPMPEPRAGQVPVDHLHLGLPTFAREAGRRQGKQRFP